MERWWRRTEPHKPYTNQTLARRARRPNVQTLPDAARRLRSPYHVRTNDVQARPGVQSDTQTPQTRQTCQALKDRTNVV
eukprot:7040534-Prymnesium_polylepis.1